MLKDKHTDYEISKLQKQIDRKKVTTVTNKVTNVTNPVQPETVLSKPIATDMQVSDGQTLVYNEDKKQWEPGTVSASITSLESQIDAATAKTPLVDTDTFPLTEPTTLKKTLWSTIKSTLKTYFDGLYLALSGGTLSGNLVVQPATDSTTGFIVNDKDGNRVFSIDTVSNIVKVGGSVYFQANGFLQLIGSGMSNGKIALGYFSTSDLEMSSDAYMVFRNSTSVTSGAGDCGISRLSAGILKITDGSTGLGNLIINKVGINTTAPDKQLEINSVDGNCLRLTYNDANGSATYYADFNVSDAGVLTINASGNIIKTADDIEITDTTKGIILTSPDASRWRVTVGDDGVLTTTEL